MTEQMLSSVFREGLVIQDGLLRTDAFTAGRTTDVIKHEDRLQWVCLHASNTFVYRRVTKLYIRDARYWIFADI